MSMSWPGYEISVVYLEHLRHLALGPETRVLLMLVLGERKSWSETKRSYHASPTQSSNFRQRIKGMAEHYDLDRLSHWTRPVL